MQPSEPENIKSQYAQLEEKNKQLELEHQIMEKKIHLEVSELETKLKDAHMITEIEDDCKKNLENCRKC